MLLICRVRRARRLCLAILLVLVPGAGLLGVAQAGLPFPTHAPLSRSGSGAQNLGTGLGDGQQLGANQYLMSGNGQYELDMFRDGIGVIWNLAPGGSPCVMWIFPGVTNNAMSNYPWTAATTPVPGAYLIMQTDGNFVQYPAFGQPAQWASNTAGNPGATLTLQSDGNLVVYQGSSALWSTSTNNYRGPVLCEGNTLQPNQGLVQSTDMNNPVAVDNANNVGAYHLLVNTDGELEILSGLSPKNLCCNKKDMVPGSYLIMQGDGNLVFYAPDGGPALWASNTAGNPGAVALISNWEGEVWVVNPATGLILYDTGGKSQGQVIGETMKPYMNP